MKCYFALTAPEDGNSLYADLFEVALKSARLNTSLDLHVLYDGPDDHRCRRLMEQYGAHVIPHRFSRREQLLKVYDEDWMRQTLGRVVDAGRLSGTFMRLDVPFVEQEDEFVLYCDIDILFTGDVRLEDLPKPRYLAAAPEYFKDLSKMDYFNAGVMLLRVPAMREKCRQIFAMLERGERQASGIVDQGYLNQVCFADMTLLPLEYNWKPYWGVSSRARIVHLHGVKPGGTVHNSGFDVNEDTLRMVLQGHEEDMAGYVYYLMTYFELLGRDGRDWLASFIGKNAELLLKKA